MSSEETTIYTREQLEGMHRLQLRRVILGMGHDPKKCGKEGITGLIDWVLELQEDSAQPEKAATKSNGRRGRKPAAPKEKQETESPKAAAGRRVPPRRGKEETVVVDKSLKDEPAGPPDKLLDGIAAGVDEVLTNLDTLGKAFNENGQQLMTEVGDLRVDIYQTKQLLFHLISWMENDGILTPENAPDRLGGKEKLEELESECSGN